MPWDLLVDYAEKLQFHVPFEVLNQIYLKNFETLIFYLDSPQSNRSFFNRKIFEKNRLISFNFFIFSTK